MRALVVFCDPPDARFQWLLKPGFRHVFCAVADGDYWVRLDAATGKAIVNVTADARFDLAAHYRNEGWTVVETVQNANRLRTPFVTLNCVGWVKAVLNIRAPLAFTPHQLFLHLLKDS
jgi:hypothetical protein